MAWCIHCWRRVRTEAHDIELMCLVCVSLEIDIVCANKLVDQLQQSTVKLQEQQTYSTMATTRTRARQRQLSTHAKRTRTLARADQRVTRSCCCIAICCCLSLVVVS
jgi:hypothetical protein